MVEAEQDGEGDQPQQHHKDRRLYNADLTGRERPRSGALDRRIEVAIENVVEGAAATTGQQRADTKQDKQDRVGPTAPSSPVGAQPGTSPPALARSAWWAANAMLHQHGHNSSQVPIGRSIRISFR